MYNKKEQNRKNYEYLENPEQIEGFDKIPVPEDLDQMIEEGIENGKKQRRHQRVKRAAKAGMGMAAAVAFASVLCVSNPSFAAKMPLIGHIFEQVETRTSVKGDFSNVAEALTEQTEDTADEVQAADNVGTDENVPKDGVYTKTSNGMTVTLSEVYYNQNAMYIAMSLHSDEPFPDNVKWVENCEDYQWDYDSVAIQGNQAFSYMKGNDFLFNYMEGSFVDDNTIAGILRLDLGFTSYYPTDEELAEKGIDWEDVQDEEGFISDEKLKEYFPNLGEQIIAPDTFSYDMNITQITFPCIDAEGMREDEGLTFKGDWDFHLDVALDTEDTQTVEVNEVNEDGVGLEKVVKTRYEMSVYMLDEDGDPDKLYFAEIFDANGEKMDYAGSYADSRQTYGYDTSKVNIYICDYDEYMDELKGYYWSDDYEEKKKTKTYEQYIAEHALYHKEIVFDK